MESRNPAISSALPFWIRTVALRVSLIAGRIASITCGQVTSVLTVRTKYSSRSSFFQPMAEQGLQLRPRVEKLPLPDEN